MDGPYAIKAGATAAMVMLLGGESLATTSEGRRYLARLDLSSGEHLARAATAESPDAARRIHLRKAVIRLWMGELAHHPDPITNHLVILGAGLDPLGIDWCSGQPDARAIEVDYENMDRKQQIIADSCAEGVARRVACIDCDLRDIAATRRGLGRAGLAPGHPSLWILEGLSYYISHEELVALLRLALGGSAASRAILEFSGPRDALSPRAQAQTQRYHEIVGRSLGGADLTVTDIDRVAADCDARVERLLAPPQAEDLLGLKRHFENDSHSAMRIALLAPKAP